MGGHVPSWLLEACVRRSAFRDASSGCKTCKFFLEKLEGLSLGEALVRFGSDFGEALSG